MNVVKTIEIQNFWTAAFKSVPNNTLSTSEIVDKITEIYVSSKIRSCLRNRAVIARARVILLDEKTKAEKTVGEKVSSCTAFWISVTLRQPEIETLQRREVGNLWHAKRR